MIGNKVANQVPTAPARQGLLDTIKERMQPEAMMEKLRESRSTLIDIGLYGGIGFLTGFLFKKYSVYVVVFVLFIASLMLLQQFGFMSIVVNWPKVHELMGIQPAVVVGDNVLIMAWGWMKANVVISASFAVGFLVGLKLG